MGPRDEMQDILRRLYRVEQVAKPNHYPSPETISYVADIGGARAFFPTDDPYVRTWFYPRYSDGKLHEPAFTRYLFDDLNSNSVFVDVGAHVGYFSIIAALRAKLVFAIEPQEFLIERIHRNIAANHFSNVNIIHAAVGDRTGFVGIPKVGNPGTGVDSSTNLVHMIRLDDYFTGAHAPTHVKIDTEGFEYQVLRGASSILETRPKLFLEIHASMDRYGYTRGDLWDHLSEKGYRLKWLDHRSAEAEGMNVSRADMERLNDAMVIAEAS